MQIIVFPGVDIIKMCDQIASNEKQMQICSLGQSGHQSLN